MSQTCEYGAPMLHTKTINGPGRSSLSVALCTGQVCRYAVDWLVTTTGSLHQLDPPYVNHPGFAFEFLPGRTAQRS